MTSLSHEQLPDEWRELIVGRLAALDPLQILVFGSRARGEGLDDSDVDLLVVVDDGRDGRDLSLEGRRALEDAPFAKDVVVTTRAMLEQRGDTPGLIYRRALREGMVIYGVDERDEKTWLRYAEEDLAAAELVATRPGFAPRVACYHAQQAAEKAYKALLVAEGQDVVITHDLRVLRDLVAPGRRAATLEVDLAWLSAWHIKGRYPGDWGEATVDDAKKAIELARAIVEAAREDIRA